VKGGVEQCRNDSDHELIFRQESYFQYLFGVKEPDWYGVVTGDGEGVLFAPELGPEFAVWMGKIATKDELSKRYGVPVYYVSEMGAVLQGYDLLLTLQGVNSDSGVDIADALPLKTKEDLMVFRPSPSAFRALAECRVTKTAFEIDVLRYATFAASSAHVAVMRSCEPGDYEYQLEARFLSHAYETRGCRHAAYTSICACGPNASVLHYGHAGAPNDRQLQKTDLALLDMGSEYHCYCSDITCSFPVSGTFSNDQRLVYEAVLDAQRNVMAFAKPGASWIAAHELAERTILTHLLRAGILLLKGKGGTTQEDAVEAMLAADVGAVFMPHGLGHFIGLDTHDVGGYVESPPARSTRPGKRKLRTNRVLRAGMVITVEPGCYFIDALLDPALADPKTAAFFDVDVLDRFRGSGGVRLEDDVLITDTGVENLTLCPRTVAEVEAVMAGGPWPPPYDDAPELKRAWGTYVDGVFSKKELIGRKEAY